MGVQDGGSFVGDEEPPVVIQAVPEGLLGECDGSLEVKWPAGWAVGDIEHCEAENAIGVPQVETLGEKAAPGLLLALQIQG